MLSRRRSRSRGGAHLARDLRVGDMFALPFDDGCFDVATSFNGIWKGCELRSLKSSLPGGWPKPGAQWLLWKPE